MILISSICLIARVITRTFAGMELKLKPPISETMAPRWQLTKSFRFEAAHRLGKGYEGICNTIHGHSWNGTLCVSTTTLNKFDFGVDFRDIGKFTKSIEGTLDHTLMLGESDRYIVPKSEATEFSIRLFERNPTCETIAQWIYREAVHYFAEQMPGAFAVEWVEIRETCTSSCRYSER